MATDSDSTIDLGHGGAGSAGAAPSATGAPHGGASSPADPAGTDAEVWIGQLWSTELVLCDVDVAKVPGDYAGVTQTGVVERVVLILERDAGGALGGRIRLGEGKTPETPDGLFQEENGWACGFQYPTRGVDYALHDAERSASRVSFSIAPSDVWNAWCKTRSPCAGDYCPTCQCIGDTCTAGLPAREQHSLPARIHFNLAVTADTLEGELRFAPAQIRLLRKQ